LIAIRKQRTESDNRCAMVSICGEHEYASATGGSFSITKRKTVVQEVLPEILSSTNGLMPEKKQKIKVLFTIVCVPFF
jgi:hypothetical protein